MRFCCFKLTALMVTATVVSLAVPVARAQEATSDVAVVSIAPLDRLLKNTSYLMRASNFPEMGGLVSIMATQYTQGLDLTKPIGARVTMEGGMPNAVIFLPMSDRDLFFGALAGMGIEPDDLGDGLFEIATPGQVIFAKDTGGWMYVAQSENAFGDLPEDPTSLLGNLPKTYDIAVRLNAGQIPQPFKDQALEQIRIGYERSMAEQSGQTEEEREAAQKMGDASIQQFEQLINETDQLIFGWSVSSEEQRVFIDTGIKFLEGTKLAAQADLAAETTSDYTNFFLPAAAAKFRFTSVIAEGDRELAKNNFRNSLSQAERQLEQAGELPEEMKTLVTELLDGLSNIMVATIDEGKFDGAGSVSVADDTLRILVGGNIADGNALAEEFKKVAAGLPDGPDVPKFEFDYATHNGVSLHRVFGPLKIADPAAQRVFGDQLMITIGTGEKSYLMALDPSGDSLVKNAIDQLADANGVQTTPFQAVVELESILRFAQAVSPNSILDNAVNKISEYSGKDKVEVNSKLIPRGGLYRISIEEGILQAIGAAAKSGAGGGGF